jgi:hypothetical protein
MSVETLLINGPAGAGKTRMAQLVTEEVLERPVHYLRMRAATDGHSNTVRKCRPAKLASATGNGWKSVHEVTYTQDRVFETLPDGLRAVRRLDRHGFIIVEADTEPSLRHAYPYDYRVFVMPAPTDAYTVFREPEAATMALQQVMQDTASFASEIFGLFDIAGLDDSLGVVHHSPMPNSRQTEQVEQLDIAEAQLRQFLNSPLGAEIASRIQLQPAYHALVEADVVVVNTGVDEAGDCLDECVNRIESLLARIRHDARRHSVLYWGNISDANEPSYKKLLVRLRTLLTQ